MKHIHFIATGGAVMHQLALALQRQGNHVTGSDDEINDPAKTNLRNAGILPNDFGWFPEKIHENIDAVVLGMHAKADNPELLRAQELHIPIYSFPEYVYEVSKNKTRVVITGSHGKTTITSMVMHILHRQGIVFDYLVGAKVAGFDQSVQLSDAPIIILEGDEYPASVIEKRPKIFFYHPHISALSGIAWDHVNVFPTYENYCSQFEHYLSNITDGAKLFYNNEDEEVVRLVKKSAQQLDIRSYQTPSFHYENGEAIVETEFGDKKMNVFGRHNIQNMQAAIAVCEALGVSRKDAYDAITSFSGAARRLEKIAENNNIVAFRDFAHAPSKLKATLNAVREAFPTHCLIACFELHTFSSLSENFLKEYHQTMNAADEAVVYFSRHALALKGLPALSNEVVHQFFGTKDLTVFSEKKSLEEKIKSILQEAKKPVCLLLMSSGTFDGIDWNEIIA
jgi:UDP-N-acetylmuramate: L-alanyl-gamma-D-glutamyl-meso-diaminopimelate ligase